MDEEFVDEFIDDDDSAQYKEVFDALEEMGLTMWEAEESIEGWLAEGYEIADMWHDISEIQSRLWG